ncbi:M23 family metallopeptidase [uncultured Weeksella sp.]|uniref:M23 family metallopeptidase n=1 Tax=uncultured Weeksella sp. TaxID=1161389 RepID=UPI00259B2115|nr:M23 family metallopeptidase [uncultured Weeksella sp.]
MKAYYLILFCCLSLIANAQFNTLTRNVIYNKTEANTKFDTKEIEKEKTNDKKKKTIKQVLNLTSKADLKKEIDSMKILIKDIKNDRSFFNQLKDSLIGNTMSQLNKKILPKENSIKNIIKYETIEEIENNIFMPISNKILITSPFGLRKHPISGVKKMHNGIDIRANYEAVFSVLDGIVVAAGWDTNGGGNYIKINHFDRFETAYLHLSETYYKVGDFVKAGFVIGKSGNSGHSTGPHLHFSVKEWGKYINPTNFLNDIIKVNNLIASNYE